MAWGTTPWGITPTRWGLGPESEETAPNGTFFIDRAYSIGTHIVRVHLSSPPADESPLSDGDANNPRMWNVTYADGTRTFNVYSVRQGPSNLIWDLYTLQELSVEGIVHRVYAPQLRDPFGILIGTPREALFGGLVAPLEFASIRPQPYDIANDAFESTFTVESSGDLLKERGVPLLKKLIIRRLLTQVGGFVHLPNYGLGIRAKEPLTTTDLVKLQSEIERQIQQEPEVIAARVRLRLDSTGILIILIQATLESGQDIPFEIPVKQV